MIHKIIPTNVITGFLGVGKTSLIKSLLRHKPEGEVWAVLVNEFGEVGIDAGLIDSTEAKVQIKEVAGGCMCCAAGVPMQVAINQLIAKAKPDRLLIEPTGLGHPKEVLKVLTQPHYQQVLAMKACITLVDARKLSDTRYTEHEIFNQQLQVADAVIASKFDRYAASSLGQLTDYLARVRQANNIDDQLANHPLENHQLEIVPWSLQQADESIAQVMALLSQSHQTTHTTKAVIGSVIQPASTPRLVDINYSSLFSAAEPEQIVQFDPRGILCKLNQGDGFYSYGWVFDPSYEFDFDQILSFIKSLQVARVKAVMITEEGIAGFNGVDGELSVVELDDAMDSRIELLSMSEINPQDIETALLQAATRLGA